SITGIPEGTYTIAYLKNEYLPVSEHGVIVSAGKTTSVHQLFMSLDPAGPPQPPHTLESYYDVQTGIVHLKWSKVDVSDLKGYIVYRYDTSSVDPVQINKVLVQDTVFSDTLFDSPLRTDTLTCSYRIKAQDDDAGISSGYSPFVHVAAPGPGTVRTGLHFTLSGTINDTASINDTIRINASFSNPSRNLEAVFWYLNPDDTLRKVTVNGKSGSDTLRFSKKTAQEYFIKFVVIDTVGSLRTDSVRLVIVTDPPVISIKGSGSGSQGVAAACTASVWQQFGTVSICKWDFDGDRIWDDSSQNVTTQHIYNEEGSYKLFLLVGDDDGNETVDSATVTIGNQPPVIDVHNPDTLISIYDTVSFSCAAHDIDGNVTWYLWDFDNSGTYDDSSETGIVKRVFNNDGVFKCKVSVRDNYGKISVDSMTVTVVSDPPVVAPFSDMTTTRSKQTRFGAEVSQQFGTIVSYEWNVNFNKDTTFEYNVAVPYISHAFADTGTFTVLCSVTDDDHNRTTSTFKVNVLSGLPKVYAASDTLVSIKDSIRLHAVGWDSLGAIASWTLTFTPEGTGGSTVIWSGNDTTIIAPPVADSAFSIIYRATDTDSNKAADTMHCKVITDAPRVELFFPDTVFVDSVNTGLISVVQEFGEVDSVLWIFGKDTINQVEMRMDGKLSSHGLDSVTVIVIDDDGNRVLFHKNAQVMEAINGVYNGTFNFKKNRSPYMVIGSSTFNDSVSVESGVTIIFRNYLTDCKKSIRFNGQQNDSIFIKNCYFRADYNSRIDFDASFCKFEGHGCFFNSSVSSFYNFKLLNSSIIGFDSLYILRPIKDIDISHNTFNHFKQLVLDIIENNSYSITSNNFNELATQPSFYLSLYYSTLTISDNNFFPPETKIIEFNYCDGGEINFLNNFVFGVTTQAGLTIVNNPGPTSLKIGNLYEHPIQR
ncbi:MAG: PKD domain-containing protein, partial [Chitinispirillaceae bacterium]|nr:PKD domain-containing protein [Chitinispirillaceae bacterium]